MSDGIEVFGGLAISDPKPLLPGGFEAGVVSFAFGTQGINGFESNGIPVNGKPVIIGNRDIFGAAAMFFPVMVSLVFARASGIIF